MNRNGISIPDQIAVVGFNNSRSAKECYPTLTSIDNKTSDSGRAAAQMMIDILNGQKTENRMLVCGLEVRESTP